MGLPWSTPLSTAATAASGTKAASHPRKKFHGLRKARCFTAVEEGSMEMIESWGRFSRVAEPGFSCVWCCFGQGVAGRLSTQLQHQEVQCECKTADGVFIELVFSVQYRVAPGRQYQAFYSLADPAAQVTSYVLDAVGTAVSRLPCDDLFLQKGGMVGEVRRGLAGVLHTHGFEIEDCLITVLAPTASVKEAMSNVKAAQRQRESAFEQGEADKLRTVKHAEASAESKYLQGQGLARFLIALSAGLRDAVKVLVTGRRAARIKQEDLGFPQPPPGDDVATLRAAGVAHLAEPEDGSQQGPSGAQQAQRKAPAAGGGGDLGAPLIEADARPPAAAAAAGQQAKLAGALGSPALLAPHAPPTPTRAAAGAKAAAGAAPYGGAASAAKTAVGF